MSPERISTLIVDGDADEANLVRGYLLEGLGASAGEVECVTTGKDALARLSGGSFDLVIVDHRLQDGEGTAFLRLLSASGPGVPAIFLSRLGAPSIALEALEAGAAEALVKPHLTPAGLAAAARHAREMNVRARETRSAEEALRRSEERLSLVLEGSGQGVWDWDLETGAHLRDGEWDARHGIAPRGRPKGLEQPPDWIHPEDAGRAFGAFLAHVQGRTAEYGCEYRVRGVDGGWRWIQDSGRVVRRAPDGRAQRFSGTEKDVTERREAEEALRRRELLLEAVNFAAGRLLGSGSWRDSLPNVLERVGTAAGASRVHLFRFQREDGRLLARLAGLWSSRGAGSGADAPPRDSFPFPPPGLEGWADSFRAGEVVVTRAEELPTGARESLGSPETSSSVEVPVPGSAAGEPWGFLGLDDCATARSWSPAELTELLAATRMLGAAIARDEAETARKAGEERLRQLLDVLPDAVLVHRGGRFVWLNPAAVRLFGAASAAELLGTEIFDRVHTDDRALVRARHERLDRPGAAAPLVEERFLRLDGSVVVVEAVPTLVQLPDGPAIQVVLRDVTARKEAEEKLRLTIESVSEAVWELDVVSGAAHVSPRLAACLGYPAEMPLTCLDDVQALLHPDDAPSTRRALEEHLAGRTPLFEIENRKRRADGSWQPMLVRGRIVERDGEGRPLRMLGVEIDMTALRRAEEAARRLQLAIEQSADVVFVTDTDATIRYVNSSFEQLYGWAREEATGQTPRMLRSGRVPRETYESLWSDLTAGRTWSGREIVNRTRDGRLVTVDATINPVLGPRGEVTGFIAVQRDVTEARRTAEQVERAQRMEMVGRLSSGLAHDFNNVLNVITGYSEMGLARPDVDEKTSRMFGEIHRAARKAAALTKQLTAFGGRRRQPPLPVDLNAIVSRAEAMLRPLIGESIRLSIETSEGPARVLADPGDVEQALVNLVVNARDATDGSGTILVRTGTFPVAPGSDLASDGIAPGEYALVSVEDDGPGIDPAVLPRIFEPFFSTKPDGKGAGLGLATVDAVARRAGGLVRVESAPGRGTTFRVLFPLLGNASTPRPPSTAGEIPSLSGPRGEGTVLVVEDDPAVLEVVRTSLVEAGYTVLTASGPAEALRLAAQAGESLKLLVSDVVLPSRTGPQTARAIASKVPGVRVLFISGWMDGGERAAAGFPGASFLPKPFSQAELRHRVREALLG